MAEDLKEYADELADEIYSSAGASNPSLADLEDAFFEIATEIAMSEGDIPNADRVIFNEPRRGKIDGYAGELESGDLFDGVLSVLVTDFVLPDESTNIPTLTATEMDALFRRVRNFVERSFNDDHRAELVNSPSVYTLADNIAKKWPVISRLRIILFTNKVLSSRIDRRDADELNSVECSYSVWDLERMHSFLLSGKVREDMHLNLLEDFGGAVPALSAHSVDSTYQAYLAVIRGDNLARIYGKWGERLLEHNVRVFLTFAGKANRGMRTTIQEDAEMFFAYNNGLTATAEEVELRNGDAGLEITGIKNFQIVNGAQTAGAIFGSIRNKKVDLSKVFVQMKLAVIDSEKSEIVVPKISQYSNTQNLIRNADFFANHPYHQRIEEQSRRMQIPSMDGQFGKNSYWFYERSRGQYQSLKSREVTKAQKRNFNEQYPLSMKFGKTDLAKYLYVWEQKPHIVALGAEKNFKNFALYIDSEWEKDALQVNDMYFRHLIAKMIIFKGTEKLVSAQDWYQAGGYRSAIVPHSISKLAHDLSKQGKVLDFDAIWDLQEMPRGVEDALKIISREVDQVIRNPQLTGMNITEWAKKQACWSRVSDLVIDLPESLNSCLISGTKEKENKRAAKKDQKVVDGIQAQSMVYNAETDFWNKVALWGLDRKLLSDGEINSLRRISQGEVVDEKQCIGILNALERLQGEGCQLILENESIVTKIKI